MTKTNLWKIYYYNKALDFLIFETKYEFNSFIDALHKCSELNTYIFNCHFFVKAPKR